MDTGTWTLKCQNCGKTFELEVKPTERVIQYAKEEACPHCHLKPMGPEALGLWHHIFDFRTKNPC